MGTWISVWYGSVHTGMLLRGLYLPQLGSITMRHWGETFSTNTWLKITSHPGANVNQMLPWRLFRTFTQISDKHELTVSMWTALSFLYTHTNESIDRSIDRSVLRLKSRDNRTVTILKWSLAEYRLVLFLDTHKDLICPKISRLNRGCRCSTKTKKVRCLDVILWNVRDLQCS